SEFCSRCRFSGQFLLLSLLDGGTPNVEEPETDKQRRMKSQPVEYIWAHSRRYQPLDKRMPWPSGRITGETVLSETGRNAPGGMKSKERRRRRRLNAKLNAPWPKSLWMTNRLMDQSSGLL